MRKIKLRYLEKSLREMAKVPPNQAIFNFGKTYGSFSPRKNDETRLLNIESALKYLLDNVSNRKHEKYWEEELFSWQPDRVKDTVARKIREAEAMLKREQESTRKERAYFDSICEKVRLKREEYERKNKVAEKKEEYTEKYRIIQSAPKHGRFSTEQIQGAINAIEE